MRNLFKTVVSTSSLNDMPAPPTEATLKAWHRKAFVSMVGSFSALGACAIGAMVGSSYVNPATPTSTIMSLMAMAASGVIVLAIGAEISKRIVSMTTPLAGAECESMLALCASEPDARVYQKAVLEQGRAFHRVDLALVERGFRTKRHEQACRKLHRIVM